MLIFILYRVKSKVSLSRNLFLYYLDFFKIYVNDKIFFKLDVKKKKEILIVHVINKGLGSKKKKRRLIKASMMNTIFDLTIDKNKVSTSVRIFIIICKKFM